jgi:Flp pilus assembly protein TadG
VKKILTYAQNHKGVTLVMMSIMLAVLIMLASLAIDISYMYFAKNQLQVAADAAALAGAANLDGSASLIQEPARRAAWKFSCKNNAAGSKVFLVTDTQADCDTNNPPTADQLNANTATNTNKDINGDIVMGYWDGSSFSPTVTPPQIANAVKVVARRTGETPGMPQVGLFLGKIFALLKPVGADWSVMAVKASAIAARPPRPSTGLVLCDPVCTSGFDLSDPFMTNQQSKDPPETYYSLSYTEFLQKTPVGKATCLKPNIHQCNGGLRDDCSTADNTIVASYIWQERIAPTTCDLIRWDNGVGNIPDDVKCAFKSTTFDTDNKTINAGATVAWKVIVPIVTECPSGGVPGHSTDVALITQFAEIVIVDVVDVKGDSTIGNNKNPMGIRISSIDCFPCGDWSHLGSKPSLVK